VARDAGRSGTPISGTTTSAISASRQSSANIKTVTAAARHVLRTIDTTAVSIVSWIPATSLRILDSRSPCRVRVW